MGSYSLAWERGIFTALFYLLMSILLERRRLEIFANILNVQDAFRVLAESEGAGMWVVELCLAENQIFLIPACLTSTWSLEEI